MAQLCDDDFGIVDIATDGGSQTTDFILLPKRHLIAQQSDAAFAGGCGGERRGMGGGGRI